MANYLFLDLSTKSSGYAISDSQGKMINYGCIQSTSENVLKRISIMQDQIAKIIDDYNIEKIIAEEVRTDYKNPHVYKILTWVQGAILLAAYRINPNIEYELIQPSSWRSKIGVQTGRGIKRDELKKADIKYVADKYGIKANDDVCDAICIMDAHFAVKDFDWSK